MALTAEQATAQLPDITTPEQLRALIAQLDVSRPPGGVTAFYSGGDAGRIARTLFAQGSDIRIIDDTEASKFLDVEANTDLALKIEQLFDGSIDDTSKASTRAQLISWLRTAPTHAQ